MKVVNKLKFFSILFLILVNFQIIGCSDDETALTQGDSPTVPPQTSMIINLNEFPDNNSSAPLFKIEPTDTILRGNWGYAAIYVGF